MIPYPSEKYPERYKVNIQCEYADLKKIMDFYGKRCGLPWKSKSAEFSFSLYIYKMTPGGVEEFENKIKDLQSVTVSVPPPIAGEEKGSPAEDHGGLGKSKTFPVPEKPDGFFSQDQSTRSETRASVFPPRSSRKQATPEEIKIAKEISAIIDFDVFEPEKLDGLEIKKENKEQEIDIRAKKESPSEQVSAPAVKKQEEIKSKKEQEEIKYNEEQIKINKKSQSAEAD